MFSSQNLEPWQGESKLALAIQHQLLYSPFLNAPIYSQSVIHEELVTDAGKPIMHHFTHLYLAINSLHAM